MYLNIYRANVGNIILLSGSIFLYIFFDIQIFRWIRLFKKLFGSNERKPLRANGVINSITPGGVLYLHHIF